MAKPRALALTTIRSLCALTIVLTAASVQGQTKAKPKPKPVGKNETRGTNQMAGAYVKFSETYSLSNGVNFVILKAAYTMEHFPSYGALQNTSDSKLVVLDVAVKNYRKEDLDFGSADNLITLVDAAGNKFSGTSQLKSRGVQSTYLTLKPGQGVGQPALNDPYRIAFVIPLDAEITKIIVNQPRVGKAEQVLRYVIAGTDKESDPANAIAPLPPEVRDPTNKAGALALKEGKCEMGKPFPIAGYSGQVVGIESITTPLSESYTPAEGKRYVCATLKLQNVDLRNLSLFDATPHDAYIKDADGEKYPVVAFLKASSLEEPGSSELSPGDTRTIRVLFEVPKSAVLESLVLAGHYYPWKLDLKGK